MLLVTPDNIVAIERFISKRWPNKRVSTQDNPDAQHKNRFIKISTLVDSSIAHYELLLSGKTPKSIKFLPEVP